MRLPILKKDDTPKKLNPIEEALQPSVEELGKWKHKGLTIAASLINIAEIPLMVTFIPIACISTAITLGTHLNAWISYMDFSLFSLFVVAAICLIPGLAIPILVALFNQHLLARAAGKYYPLFARRLGQTSIVWAATALLGLYYFTQTTDIDIVVGFMSGAVIFGYFAQLFISRRVVRRQMGKSQSYIAKGPALRLDNHVATKLTEKIEAMECATTSGDFQTLAKECLELMPNKPAALPDYQQPEHDAAHQLVDTLMRAKMPTEADRVSSRMMHFIDKE